MYRDRMTFLIILVLFNLSFLSIVKTDIVPVCETLKDVQSDEDGSAIKLRRVRALCDGIEASKKIVDQENLESIPDFNLNQIDSENDVNQILKRFRRARSSSSGGRSSSSSSSSRSSSSSSRSSSSSSGSRYFGGSRSSSSSSGGSSRVFSRGSSSSSSSSSSSGSRGGLFSRGGTSGSGSSSHRVRDAIRSVVRKPSSSGSGSGGLPGTGSSSGSFSGTGATKTRLSDKIRKITHGTGGSSGSRFGTGGGSSGFGTGGSSGSGGSVWVRAGKTFLPHAVRFGKRYYQRRKYNKGMYAGAGAGAGYYAGSRMNNHRDGDYPYDNYGYPPNDDYPPEQIDGQTPTVFYCLQQDLNTTLVNKTLDAEGFGVCNVSGRLLTCPIEIECKTSEADNCCEDEQGTPYCCGGPIPVEYTSENGGYGDDWEDATDSLNKLLNIITAICLMLATICFTVWQQQE